MPAKQVWKVKTSLGSSGLVRYRKPGFAVRSALALILTGLAPVIFLVACLALTVALVVPLAIALTLLALTALILAPLVLVGRTWLGCSCFWPYWLWRFPGQGSWLRRSSFCWTLQCWTWLC